MRGEQANLTIQGQLRTKQRHNAWVVNKFHVKGTRRTPHRSLRGKDYTGEVVPFGDVCLGRNHSEDGAKLNMRWMRGVFVGNA